ncbi:hypothetical protein CN491_23935 [Bacillus cereus]|uniref:Uncharacterized protein n=1 Tax=Bacillus cereus TaxID=1396 RepID=A0A2B2FQH5_BACCE|nr:hypothetical protein CN491_23935 [Bacillus cereus]PFP73906.1 hypothetical protein COJ95_20950 [Bacillus cereus]
MVEVLAMFHMLGFRFTPRIKTFRKNKIYTFENCLKLIVTTAFTIRDLNPRDYAHAGRTQKRDSRLCYLF